MAATYDFTPKANSLVDLPSVGGNNVVGTLESTAQLAMYKITIKDDSDTAIDLRDYDGANGSEYDLIIREIAPLMVWTPDGDTGVIHVVVDGHAQSAAALQVRLRALVAGLGLGTTAAANDTTVEAGVSFVVAAS